jgi:O-methyltransferase
MTETDNEIRLKLDQLRNLRLFRHLPPEYPHTVVIPSATYSPWAAHRHFAADLIRIMKNTMVDMYRCYELWCVIKEALKVPGDILEVGVWRGGTGCLMALQSQRLDPTRKIYLCDTFAGVVKAGDNDPIYRGGEHANTNSDIVRDLANACELQNVVILEGVFPDDTGTTIEATRFCLCHIDVDTYSSAKDVFEWVWPKLSQGGIVIFDDFGFAGCEGVTRLVEELGCIGNAVMIHNLNGHALFVKSGVDPT